MFIKFSGTDLLQSQIPSKTFRGKNTAQNKTSPKTSPATAGEQPFPIQVVTGYPNIKHLLYFNHLSNLKFNRNICGRISLKIYYICLFNLKILTKNYILDILMVYSKVLLSAKFIICDDHLK